MVEERRQHRRLVPSSPLFISLDHAQSGLLLDLCEGGLAVASLVPRNLDEVVSLAFDLPEGTGRIEAKAKIAWTRDAGHLTGVRFVDLDNASYQQLSDWISAGTNLRLAPSQEPFEPVFVTRSTYARVDPISHEAKDLGAMDLGASLFATPFAGEAETEQEPEFELEKSEEVAIRAPERVKKSRHYIELFLAVVILSWALVFVGFQMGSTGASKQSREAIATPRLTETSPRPELASMSPSAAAVAAPVVAPRAATAPTSAPPIASKESSLVLQVGAMKVEDNAVALAQDLRKRKFPAFVFQHGNDRLYRVAIGPYSDPDSSAKVRDQLEKQGFKPMLQHWNKE